MSADSMYPAKRFFAITKHDTNPVGREFDAIHVGGAGDVALKSFDGETVTFKGLAAGSRLDAAGSHVMSTGTTATDLVGMTGRKR